MAKKQDGSPTKSNKSLHSTKSLPRPKTKPHDRIKGIPLTKCQKCKKFCTPKRIFFITLMICLNIAIYFAFSHYSKYINKWVKKNIGYFVDHSFPYDWICVILVMQLFLLFMVPGFHLFQTLLSFTIHIFWKAFLMIWASHNFAAVVVYLMTKVLCKKKINNHLKGSKYYRFVIFESKSKPI